MSISVRDAFLPANTGVYALSPDQVRRTDAEPDVELEVAALARGYLGGFQFGELAAAGLVTERRPGGLARLDRLFAPTHAPWGGTYF